MLITTTYATPWLWLKYFLLYSYRKYPYLVLTQIEIISNANYLVRILFER